MEPIGSRHARYSAFVRLLIPVIAVPLRQNEPAVPLSLQTAFNRAYDGGPYRRGAVDYSKPPYPPLDESQEQWRAALMLRGH